MKNNNSKRIVTFFYVPLVMQKESKKFIIKKRENYKMPIDLLINCIGALSVCALN
jgi:hypothetical protein